MLCINLPLRSTFKSICPDVERHLARLEYPQVESTKTPEALEGIELRNAINDYLEAVRVTGSGFEHIDGVQGPDMSRSRGSACGVGCRISRLVAA